MSDMADDGRLGTEIAAEIKRIGTETQGQLRNLQDSFQRDLAEARRMAEEGKKAAGENKEYVDASVKAALDSAIAKFEAYEEASKKRLQETSDEFLVALNRRVSLTGGAPQDNAKARAEATEFKRVRASIRGEAKPGDDFTANDDELKELADYSRAFRYCLLRKDEKRWTGDEAKALTTGEDPGAGWLVPPAMLGRTIQKIYETSPLRQLATVIQIGTDRLEYPIDDNEAGAGWVGEEESRAETSTPTIATGTILVHEQYAKPKITQRLLDDAATDIEGWLANKVADKFARMEATSFITGSGLKRPRGILTYPAGTGRGLVKQVTTGNASALTADSLVTLPFQILENFQGNARFLMKRATLATIALFKDTTNQYLFAPGLREGVGMTLVGYPISFADDMPAVAANSLSIAFGDFREAYLVVDRLGVVMLRDPYSSKPFVEFYSRRRVGGDVINSDAIVLLKTAA